MRQYTSEGLRQFMRDQEKLEREAERGRAARRNGRYLSESAPAPGQQVDCYAGGADRPVRCATCGVLRPAGFEADEPPRVPTVEGVEAEKHAASLAVLWIVAAAIAFFSLLGWLWLARR